jgi:hypothetical protein
VHKEGDSGGNVQSSTNSPGTGQTGSVITAGSFVNGTWYEIVTTGTTDFTLIGAADSNVGTVFQATGVGVGTGTARSGLDSDDALGLCFFISEGPSSDHDGVTAQIEDGGTLQTATIGQKAGTVGAPPVSNITIIETSLNLTSHNPTRGRLQGATSRNWINLMLVLEPRKSFLREGITPTDLDELDRLVALAGGNTDNIFFGWNEDFGQWEAYETTDPGTLRATRDSQNIWS